MPRPVDATFLLNVRCGFPGPAEDSDSSTRECAIFRPRRFDRGPKAPIGPRINDRIRIREVRCIGDDGKQVGVLPTEEALAMAREAGLDLVEIVPNERPPVVKIMDYGKYKYEQQKKEKKNRAGNIELHEIRLRPNISEHDLSIKLGKAREFIDGGHRINFYVQFRGREMSHPERGQQLLERVVQELGDLVRIESDLQRQGARRMNLVVAPAKSLPLGKPEKPKAP